MKAIAQREIISLISDLNAFVDNAEQLISATQTNYERDKSQLLNRQGSELSSLETSYKRNCSAVSSKSSKAISDANSVLADIDKLDAKLSKVDKYYVKTKSKKKEFLSATTSERYSEATDYLETLERIKADFNVLFKKYSEDILPGLINGLNYLFSSKRKKDYEELIILRNTVASFVKEMEEILPTLTEENFAELKNGYLAKRGATIEHHKRELADLESQHSKTLDVVADRICTNLDAILPDQFVDYRSAMTSKYIGNVVKVNTSS